MASTLPNSFTSVTRVFAASPDVGSHSSVNSALVTEHIGNVEAKIMARVAEVYSVASGTGVVGAPALQAIATDLSLYSLYSGVSGLAKGLQNDNHPLLASYSSSKKMLDLIVSGDMPLVSGSGTLIEARGDNDARIVVTSGSYSKTFNELDMVEQRIDPDRITAIRGSLD